MLKFDEKNRTRANDRTRVYAIFRIGKLNEPLKWKKISGKNSQNKIHSRKCESSEFIS